ncbi:MAG: hypothetical protein M0R37_13600 [Bacteroidales bacterium]|nr:hypothetical protein [Bacteroidales bacterium]
MKGYTTIAKIEAYLTTEIEAAFQPNVTAFIEAVEDEIDRITHRNFIADAVASARTYDADGGRELFIDEAVDVSEVSVDDVVQAEGADEDYDLMPANTTPKRVIRFFGGLPRLYGGVEVTAKWGFSVACPAAVSHAATVLVADKISKAFPLDMQDESIGRYSASYRLPEDVKQAHETLKAFTKPLL